MTDQIDRALPTWLLAIRRPLAFGVQALLLTLAYALAFLLRFDFNMPPVYQDLLWMTFPFAVAIKLLVFSGFGLHQGWWRYAGMKDLENLVKAATLATAAIMGMNYVVLELRGVPRSVYLVDPLLSVILVGGARLSVRWMRETLLAREKSDTPAVRLLVIGTGDLADTLLRNLGRLSSARYQVVGLLDDNAARHGLRIHGVSVLGSTAGVGDQVRNRNVGEIVFAHERLSRTDLQRIVALCEGTGVRFKVLATSASSQHDSRVSKALRSVEVEDLLGRLPVPLEVPVIAELVRGKVVLVTGAGGSIGSEICRQVAHHDPARLILLERSENALFQLTEELSETEPGLSYEPVVGDVGDVLLMDSLLARTRPHLVVHAAAHKHVPLMEHNASEAVRNNVFGTRTLALKAAQHGVQTFVLISTDKAVNPTSVMGTTKRVAELVVQAMATAWPETRFVAVRFGNVLGSNGSVIPTFKAQIARGGPLTITHPDMRRYFMTIPEASQLVLTAAALGEGGEVFVLDMDEPVRIVDLARNLIRLAGLRPEEDIPIVFTGLRPGEKLFEELSVAGEDTTRTRHPKIFVGKVAALPPEILDEGLLALEEAAAAHGDRDVRHCLEALVSEAKLSPELPSPLPSGSGERLTRPPSVPSRH